MTPAARYAAAIVVLDQILAGSATEKALLQWARNSRFAGSKDRAAVRDIVFDGVRKKRSAAWRGGAETGRGIILGLLIEDGIDPQTIFTGQGHAPAELTNDERVGQSIEDAPDAVRNDHPNWMTGSLQHALGSNYAPVMQLLRTRADVFLRVNTVKSDLAHAKAALAEDGIETVPCALASTALRVTRGARQVQRSAAYLSGFVELQDSASQATVQDACVQPGMKILDYCAGGGGKALALAAATGRGGHVTAHDISTARMRDIPDRAARGGVSITCAEKPDLQSAGYDLVFIDAPCSGSGSWRRAPDGKWALTRDRLTALCDLQAQIMKEGAQYVAPGGRIAYATCSVLQQENMDQIDLFCDTFSGSQNQYNRQYIPLDGGDGFFIGTIIL